MEFKSGTGNWKGKSISVATSFEGKFNQPTQVDATFVDGKQPQSNYVETVREFDLLIAGTDGLWDNLPPGVILLLTNYAAQQQIMGTGANLDSEAHVRHLVDVYAGIIRNNKQLKELREADKRARQIAEKFATADGGEALKGTPIFSESKAFFERLFD